MLGSPGGAATVGASDKDHPKVAGLGRLSVRPLSAPTAPTRVRRFALADAVVGSIPATPRSGPAPTEGERR